MPLLPLLSQAGWTLADDTLARLQAFGQLLQRWNRVYNLTTLADEPRLWTHHIADCLALRPPLQRWAAGLAEASSICPSPRPASAARVLRLLDVGSGGGLPSVVLAITEPGWQVHAVDAVAKKVGFLRQVKAELGLSNLHPHHARVEQLRAAATPAAQAPAPLAAQALPVLPALDVITSRAFASLADFTRWTHHLAHRDTVWVAMKGKRPDDELQALPPDIDVFHVEPLAVPGLEAARCLVWMKPSAPCPATQAPAR